MMQPILNAMRLQAQMAALSRASSRIGTVRSYDPANYCAKVLIQPEGTETGWLPVTSPWIGNGWGMFCPPSIGDMVEVQYQEDDFNAGFIVGRFFNDSERPLNVTPGEFWLVHQSGSFLKFHNDGTVEVTAASTMTYSATQHHFIGPVQMDNTLNTNEEITSLADIQDNTGTNTHTMSQMRGIYNTHTHNIENVQGGLSTIISDAPNQEE